jgi:hypothetical protein
MHGVIKLYHDTTLSAICINLKTHESQVKVNRERWSKPCLALGEIQGPTTIIGEPITPR